MKQMNPFTRQQRWQRAIRKYRRLQARLLNDQPLTEQRRLSRKLGLLQARLLRWNRQWQVGIAASVLAAGLSLPAVGQQQTPFPAELNVADLNGDNGFTVPGLDSLDLSGRIVSDAGDVNGDGIDDVVIGARYGDSNGNTNAGEAYVIFGQRRGFSAEFDLSALDGTNGFVVQGRDYGSLGNSVSSAGDVNGDGIDDLIVGAYTIAVDGGRYTGESYVIFGQRESFEAELNVAELNGNNGFTVAGLDSLDFSGFSVSGVGDVNGDRVDDIVIGTSADSANVGESYVIFGRRRGGFDAQFDLSTLDGANGFVVQASDSLDRLPGILVNRAGDVNGDGISDIILGSFGANPNGLNGAGESYVIFGQRDGFEAELDVSTLNGQNGFAVPGLDSLAGLGFNVTGVGDVNNDGLDDIAIGSSGETFALGAGAGVSYVVFGRREGFEAELDVSTLNGQNGFIVQGSDAEDFLDISSEAGDVNGDRVDDLIVGAFLADPDGRTNAGEAYVIYGRRRGDFASTLDVSTLDGSNGFTIQGGNADDELGFWVSSAGDINGDRIDDVIVGAPFADPNGLTDAGESYVIFGRRTPHYTAPQHLQVYPNVFDQELFVRTDQSVDQLHVELRSVRGDQRYTLEASQLSQVKEGLLRLNTAAVAPGHYVLRLTGQQGTATRHVLKR